MGRVKVPIAKIPNTTTRQVTFSKRRSGLIKKAYELSVLCDIDVALIMFSPSGKLSHFSGRKRIEDVLARYLKLPEEKAHSDQDKGTSTVSIQNKEALIELLMKLKTDADAAAQRSSNPQAGSSSNLSEGTGDSEVQDLKQEVVRSEKILENLKKLIRLFHGDIQNMHSISPNEYDIREKQLMEVLNHVSRKKNDLLRKAATSASMPIPTMLTQQSSTILQTTSGAVHIQPHQEGSSPPVHPESLIFQHTIKGKIPMQPMTFEGNLGMKEEEELDMKDYESFSNMEPLLPQYLNETPFFNNGVEEIITNPIAPAFGGFQSTQINSWDQSWATNTSATSAPSFLTAEQFPLFQQSFEDGANPFNMPTEDIKTFNIS